MEVHEDLPYLLLGQPLLQNGLNCLVILQYHPALRFLPHIDKDPISNGLNLSSLSLKMDASDELLEIVFVVEEQVEGILILNFVELDSNIHLLDQVELLG